MSLDLEEGLARWATRSPGCWRRAVGPICPMNRSGCLTSPTTRAFPFGLSTPRLDAHPEPPLPGQYLFVRGETKPAMVVAGRSPRRFPVRLIPRTEIPAVLAALANGVSALVLQVGDADAARGIDRLLEGVYLDLVPIRVDAAQHFASAADALLVLLADVESADRPSLSVDLGPTSVGIAERADGPSLGTWAWPPGVPPRCAASGRCWWTVPLCIIAVPMRRGSWPGPWRPGRLSAVAD